MNTDRETLGEQPIFTCHAHVFHIDPKTKRTWITASTKAVSVSFFYDSSRNLYRIISVEGSKAVINSTITPNMSFTQTSQKFGQWSDVRANTVYGLGFSSEAELTKFVEKFQEVKEATKNALTKTSANGSSAATPITSTNTSPVSGRTSVFQQQNDIGPNDGNAKDTPQNTSAGNVQNVNPESPSHTTKTSSNANNIEIMKQSLTINNSSTDSSTTHSEQQLKYENERLKLALAQSCANAKKWEIELTTLKSNNNRLTSALQESTANVDEWKRQLHTYKEENLRLKRDMDAMKPTGNNSGAANDINEEMRIEIIKLKSHIISLEKEMHSHNQEIEIKTSKMSLKDKNTEQSFKRIADLSDKLSKALIDLCNVQQELEKVTQEQKST